MPSRSFREALGGLSDQQWLAALQASVTQRDVHGVQLPSFPSDALQSSTVGSANEQTIGEAFNFYSFIKAACAELGQPLRPDTRVLDFGVGWGRIVRCFLREIEPGGLFGVDVSEDFLEAARATGCPAQLSRIEPLGRLPYPDRSFDLVFAYSVFTHLPEHVQDHWLSEISRVMRPRGVLIATVEPPRFFEFFAHMDAKDPALHPWHAAMATKIQADPTLRPRLEAGGFVYLPTGDGGPELYGDCVMTQDYVRRHWGRFMRVHGFLDDPSRFWQAVVTCQAA